MNQDKIKGMMYGLALGDCLGTPFEFSKTTPKMKYDGYVSTIPFSIRYSQYFKIDVEPGSISDDTEMSIRLYKCLLENNFVYKCDEVIKTYLDWASSSKLMGKNTRKLFKNLKTVNGYNKRSKKIFENEEENNKMQSNGSLMRSSSLCIIYDETESMNAVKQDAYLTNPNKINLDIGLLYNSFLRSLLRGDDNIQEIIDNYILNGEQEIIKEILQDINNKKDRDIVKLKGWVGSAFYIATKCILMFNNFQDGIDWVINHPGSDSDTNATITGALLGAKFGYTKISKETRTKINIQRMNNYLLNHEEYSLETLFN